MIAKSAYNVLARCMGKEPSWVDADHGNWYRAVGILEAAFKRYGGTGKRFPWEEIARSFYVGYVGNDEEGEEEWSTMGFGQRKCWEATVRHAALLIVQGWPESRYPEAEEPWPAWVQRQLAKKKEEDDARDALHLESKL